MAKESLNLGQKVNTNPNPNGMGENEVKSNPAKFTENRKKGKGKLMAYTSAGISPSTELEVKAHYVVDHGSKSFAIYYKDELSHCVGYFLVVGYNIALSASVVRANLKLI